MLAIGALLTLLITLLITAFLPMVYRKSKADHLCQATLLLIMFEGGEVAFSLLFRSREYFDDYYWTTRVKLGWATLSLAIYGCIVGTVTSIRFKMCEAFMTAALYFALVYVFGAWVAANSLPVLIQAFIYPAETIITVGFITIYMIFYITGPSILKGLTTLCCNTSKKKTQKTTTSRNCLALTIITLSGTTVLPVTVQGLLILYLSVLRLFQESPTSQFTQVLLALLPTVIAVTMGYLIKKKLAQNNMNQDLSGSPTKEVNNDDDNNDSIENSNDHVENNDSEEPMQTHTEESNSQNNSNNTTYEIESEQHAEGELRRRMTSGTESNGESQNVQVEVEVHQTATNASVTESTV